MANGIIKRMGQLFLSNYAQDVNSTINAPHYNYTPVFTFKDTNDSAKKHNWVEFNEGGQKKYICTNGIFYGAKYNDLIKSFKKITLDGELYELRVPTKSEILYLYENKLLSKVSNQMGKTSYSHYVLYGTKDNGYMYCMNRNDDGSKPSFVEYERDADKFEDWLLCIPVLVIVNNPPTISGKDENLGEKTNPFNVTYFVSDVDANQELTIKEKLNETVIRTIKNPTKGSTLTCSITNELFASLSMGTTNTIEIEVTDGSATTYRRYTFIKTNSAPFIKYTGASNLGQITSKPVVNYSVSDNEGDTIIVTEKINGKTIRQFTATSNTNYTITIANEIWLTCGSDINTIEISASDVNGGTSYKYITFIRQVNKVQITTKNPIETDAAATKIMVSPDWDKTGCTGKVEVCNNGFDTSPTWEDMTAMSALNRPYVFTNTTKTAAKWGIKIRLTLTKNEGYTGEVAIYGFGGAYE